jgi:hypothetical protein
MDYPNYLDQAFHWVINHSSQLGSAVLVILYLLGWARIRKLRTQSALTQGQVIEVSANLVGRFVPIKQDGHLGDSARRIVVVLIAFVLVGFISGAVLGRGFLTDPIALAGVGAIWIFVSRLFLKAEESLMAREKRVQGQELFLGQDGIRVSPLLLDESIRDLTRAAFKSPYLITSQGNEYLEIPYAKITKAALVELHRNDDRELRLEFDIIDDRFTIAAYKFAIHPELVLLALKEKGVLIENNSNEHATQGWY